MRRCSPRASTASRTAPTRAPSSSATPTRPPRPSRSRPPCGRPSSCGSTVSSRQRASAVGEMAMVFDTFRYYAGAAERLLGDTIPVAGGVAMTFREPLGVVALIVPWNFPLTIAAWKLAPALAAGNTVVLKPAELTPLTALRFERIALDAGLPEGVVNVVVGPGPICRQRLVEHAHVAEN